MTYCQYCGTKNSKDATACKKCGEKLYQEASRAGRSAVPAGGWERHEQECFGLPRFGAIVGITIGLIVILFGAGFILSRYYGSRIEIWPLAVAIFGVMIVAAALSALRGK